MRTNWDIFRDLFSSNLYEQSLKNSELDWRLDYLYNKKKLQSIRMGSPRGHYNAQVTHILLDEELKEDKVYIWIWTILTEKKTTKNLFIYY